MKQTHCLKTNLKHDTADALVLHSTAQKHNYTEVQNNWKIYIFLLNEIPNEKHFFVEKKSTTEKHPKNISNLRTNLNRTNTQPPTVLCVLVKGQQLQQHTSI